MKTLLIAIAVLAVTALPAFANDVRTPGAKETTKPTMQHPEMKQEMMRDPQHLLMMAHHRNFVTFARKLEMVARQGETVPVQFARTAVAEMRRSVEEVEKYRASAMRNVSAEMQKTMDAHLVDVKTHLRQLEDLAKKDLIRSQEVIDHLQFFSQACRGVDCGMMYGRGMYGQGRGYQRQHMMPEHGRMMQEMMKNMKEQDAQLTRQVAEMKRAPKDQKVDLMADIVSQMVQQRAAMTTHMEKMMKYRMQHPRGASMMSPCMQCWTDDDYIDYDDEDADEMMLQGDKMRRR